MISSWMQFFLNGEQSRSELGLWREAREQGAVLERRCAAVASVCLQPEDVYQGDQEARPVHLRTELGARTGASSEFGDTGMGAAGPGRRGGRERDLHRGPDDE